MILDSSVGYSFVQSFSIHINIDKKMLIHLLVVYVKHCIARIWHCLSAIKNFTIGTTMIQFLFTLRQYQLRTLQHFQLRSLGC